MIRARRLRSAVAVLLVVLAVAAGPVAHAPEAAAADCTGVQPVATAPEPHEDGRYTPILLVHGFLGDSTAWHKPATWSTPESYDAQGFSLIQKLSTLPGAALYTVDYRTSHLKWFAHEGGGGYEFLRVADCVLAADLHQGHDLVVVAHSMGGLIARWAITDAPGAAQRRERAGLMVTLGTPYEGSFVAVVGDLLVEAMELGLARTTVGTGTLAALHLVAVVCDRLNQPEFQPCRFVEDLFDFLATVKAFKPGSPELRALSDWPATARARTLTTETVLTDTHGLFRKRTTETRLGDVVVSQPSATAGDHPEMVAECRYTVDGLTAAANAVLDNFGLRLTSDPAGYFLTGLLGACFHSHQPQLVQLTTDIVNAVADELLRYEPAYAYRTADRIGIVHPASPHAPGITIDGRFSGIEFTEDGGHVVAVEWPREPQARVVAIDAATGARREFPCDGCVFAVAAGGSRIAWLQRGAVMAVDLNGTDPPAPTGHRMPPSASGSGLDEPRLVAFVNDLAYVSEDLAPGTAGQRGSLTVLDASGGFRRWEGGSLGQIAVSRDGTVAYGSYTRDGSCRYHETVRLLSGDGEPVETDLSGLRRFDGNAIDDLWWGRDGALYATMASWKCGPEWWNGTVTLVPSSLWRLDGDVWVNVDAGPLAAVRQLTREIKAVQLPDGTLWTEINGQGTQVASGVTWIATPPGHPDPEVRPSGPPLPPVNPAFEPYVGYWLQIEGGLIIEGTYRGTYNAGALSPDEHFELRQEGDRVVAVFTNGERRWLYTDGQGHLAMNRTPEETLGNTYFCDGTNGCWWDF